MTRARLPGRQTYTDLERSRQWLELREGFIIIGGSALVGIALVLFYLWLRSHAFTAFN